MVLDPDFGSTLTVSTRDSQSNCRLSWKITGQPCEFQAQAADHPVYERSTCAGRLWQPGEVPLGLYPIVTLEKQLLSMIGNLV